MIDIKDIEFLDEDLGEIREEVELSEKEKIYDIKKGPYPKKYTAVVRNNKTQKYRKINYRFIINL